MSDKTFTLFWRHGKRELVRGRDIADAMTNAELRLADGDIPIHLPALLGLRGRSSRDRPLPDRLSIILRPAGLSSGEVVPGKEVMRMPTPITFEVYYLVSESSTIKRFRTASDPHPLPDAGDNRG